MGPLSCLCVFLPSTSCTHFEKGNRETIPLPRAFPFCRVASLFYFLSLGCLFLDTFPTSLLFIALNDSPPVFVVPASAPCFSSVSLACCPSRSGFPRMRMGDVRRRDFETREKQRVKLKKTISAFLMCALLHFLNLFWRSFAFF